MTKRNLKAATAPISGKRDPDLKGFNLTVGPPKKGLWGLGLIPDFSGLVKFTTSDESLAAYATAKKRVGLTKDQVTVARYNVNSKARQAAAANRAKRRAAARADADLEKALILYRDVAKRSDDLHEKTAHILARYGK